MSWVEVIEQEFEECLEFFPELENQEIKLAVQSSDRLDGTNLRYGNQRSLVLSVPPLLHNQPRALRPIILYQLSYFIDSEDPNRVFVERADEKSKQLWQKLQEEGLLMCEVVR